MKKNLFLLVLLLLSIIINAQGFAGIIAPSLKDYSIVDSAKYVFAYELTFISDTSKMKETEKNKLFLQIGDEISKFASVDFYLGRELESQIKEMGLEKKGSNLLINGKGLAGTEVYKDFVQRKETITTRLAMVKEVFIYDGDIPSLKWDILPETKTILEHLCMKATTNFLGRTYEAWFTIEIPINNGPWKFGGLPGMILEVSDMQGHYNFVCTGIKELKEKEPIIKSDAVYVKKSRKDINKLIKLQHRNITLFGETMNIRIRLRDNASSSYPFNPIELE